MISALEANALTKKYGSIGALRDCSLRIPTGHVVGLVGPNGAGKTTLLHLAVGLLDPTAGDIRVLGWSPRQHPLLVLARVGFWRRTDRSTGDSRWGKCSSWDGD